jgi:hypothetical protein
MHDREAETLPSRLLVRFRDPVAVQCTQVSGGGKAGIGLARQLTYSLIKEGRQGNWREARDATLRVSSACRLTFQS